MVELKWLWERIGKDKPGYIVALFLAFMVSVASIVVPHITRIIVDTFITNPDAATNIVASRSYLIQLLVFLVVFTLFRTVLSFISMMLFEKISQNVVFKLKNELYDKLQRQDNSYYVKYSTGDLMSTMTGDLDMIRHSISWLLKTIMESLTVFFIALVYLYTINHRLTLWMAVLAPFIFILTHQLSKEVRPMYGILRDRFTDLNSAAQENIAANRVVKAFGTEQYEIEKFNKISYEYQVANENVSYTWIKYNPALEMLSQSFSVILLLVGGIYMMRGDLSYGDFAAYSGLIWAISNPMRQIGILINDIQRIAISTHKIHQISEAKSKITKEKYIPNPRRLIGDIEFVDVSFGHDDDDVEVLKNVSFKLDSKKRVAIIGPTGSGKTTLVNLLMRRFDPLEGYISVDGIDIREYELDEYQSNIAITTQNAILFSDTIQNNIAYGMKDFDEAKMIDAAKSAFAYDFIEDTKEGYETLVGEDGVGLSGGQQQRVALARAFASERPILILDDTTSALDNKTEKLILKSLDLKRDETTQVIITQRVSTAKASDLILVLDKGSIIEQGTHETLIEKQGYYAMMNKLQREPEEGV